MTKNQKLLFPAAVVAVALILGLIFNYMDFSAPELTLVESFEKACGTEISVYDLVERVQDKSEVTLSLRADEGRVESGGKCVVFDEAGRCKVEIVAEDAHGNTTVGITVVTITDTVPPVISAQTVVIYEKETPNYAAAVRAEDQVDGDLSDQVTVDDSQVNYEKWGTYTVTYSVSDRSGNQASCNAQVIIKPTPADGIRLSEKSIELDSNRYYQLKATVEPADWDGEVIWESSDEKVATVSEGLVYWMGKGECTITAKADEIEAKCKVKCKAIAPTYVTLSSHSLELDEGQSRTLTAAALPSNWKGKYTWSSSDPSVATVSGGKVTWVSNGNCYITVYADDEVYDSCKVTCLGGFSLGDLFDDLFDQEEETPDAAGQQPNQVLPHN